jgi:hypothetical protein
MVTLDEMVQLLSPSPLADPARLLTMVGTGFLRAQRGEDGVWRFDEQATLSKLRVHGMVPTPHRPRAPRTEDVRSAPLTPTFDAPSTSATPPGPKTPADPGKTRKHSERADGIVCLIDL